MSRNVTQTVNESETLYTEKEAAKKYRVSTITLYRARTDGISLSNGIRQKLKFYQIGRRILYGENQLQEFFKSFEQNGEGN